MTWSVNYRTRFRSAETGWPAADGSIDRLDNRWTSPPRLPFIFQDEFLGNVLRKSFPVEIKEPRSMTINNAVRVALWIKLYRWTLLYYVARSHIHLMSLWNLWFIDFTELKSSLTLLGRDPFSSEAITPTVPFLKCWKLMPFQTIWWCVHKAGSLLLPPP